MNDKSVSKKVPLLGGVLVLQLALVGLLFWQGGDDAPATNEPLLAIERNSVDHLEIVADGKTVNLRREDGDWVLANGLPADDEKVSSLLEQVGALRPGWPVANTESAQERFEVSDDSFQRKITVFSQDRALGTLLIGTTPSFKQVHIRKQGEDKIYAVSFNAFDVASDADRWLDTAVIQPQGEIQSVTSGDFKVAREDGQWPAEGVTSAGKADKDVSEASHDQKATEGESVAEPASRPRFDAEAFSTAMKDLRVLGLADNLADLDAPDNKGDADSDGSLTRFTVTVSTDQGEYTYELFKKDANYYIRRNDYEETFRLAKRDYDAIARVRDFLEEANS